MDTSLCYAKFSMTNNLSFWALAKNPKKFKAHFKFMDTSPKAQYDKTLWQKGRSVWQTYHYNSTLSLAQHNNTFSKSLNLSLIAKNKRLLLVIASRLNGKTKHEKALKNDIWISIFDRKRFKVPKNAKSHYTTQKLMNGNKGVVKFKCVLFLEQMLITPSVKYPCLLSFWNLVWKLGVFVLCLKFLNFKTPLGLNFATTFFK